MLLYTRVAPPKVPKKRSRAGCNYCKEKKKKCDETRPQCARCLEHDEECVYEAIKPRQRRKREATAPLTLTPSTGDSSSNSERVAQSPTATSFTAHWSQEGQSGDGILDTDSVAPDLESPLSELPLPSALDGIFNWSPRDVPLLSPVDSVNFQFPNLDATNFPTTDDHVEEIVRQDSYAQTETSHSARSPSLALMLPVQLPSPRLEFTSPAFSEFSDQTSRRALVDHFCNTLSRLIVFREECGNPFQQLVLPLCHNSPSVMNAVYALASAHLDYRGVQYGEKSVYFHNKSIQGLGKLIAKGGDANRNELLATIMLLVYYEVLVQKGRSNIVDGHLKGAMTIMGNSQSANDPTGVFLERAFRFYDVIAALSLGTAPVSTSSGTNSLTPFPPVDSSGASSPFGNVDTLLGMATSLWPVIHRLSNLLILKDQLDAAITSKEYHKVAVLRTEFEITATSIENALQEWQPTLPADSVLSQYSDEFSAEGLAEKTRLQSILNSAWAYRHSALVYLYRTIYSYPRHHPLVQRHAHVSLTHCLGTVKNAGPMGALLWPLFVAACEATSPGDREAARQAFVAIDRRQGMINIERAWKIVQEVWKRADKADSFQEEDAVWSSGVKRGGDLWRRVSEDMGVTIVFG